MSYTGPYTFDNFEDKTRSFHHTSMSTQQDWTYQEI